LRGDGVAELWETLARRRDELAAGGELEARRRRNLLGEVVAAAAARLRADIEQAIADDPELVELVGAVQRREVDPSTAVDRIVSAVRARTTP